ncbi:MAG: GNAT family N-acetyltransferase [Terriglobia bacterium]
MGGKQTAGSSASRKNASRKNAGQAGQALAARVEIRACRRLEEFERCVELQRLVWGFADVDVAPSALFVVAAHTGGQIIGAYDGAEMIGFVLAFAGVRGKQTFLHSHMAAVLPAYQNAGIGRRLKLAQRADGLARGIRLVEWTFDPLEIRNAYFNLEKLGIIVRTYLLDVYGRTTSPLHAGLPTDRLLAEWWLDSARVEARVAGRAVARASSVERIRVPAQIAAWRRSHPVMAERAQQEVREQFQHWLAKGYAAVGFEMDAASKDGIYLVAPYEG